jgi:hypothetical protein
VTDAKVIAPFAILHACAMALGVGMLVVLLRGTLWAPSENQA